MTLKNKTWKDMWQQPPRAVQSQMPEYTSMYTKSQPPERDSECKFAPCEDIIRLSENEVSIKIDKYELSWII